MYCCRIQEVFLSLSWYIIYMFELGGLMSRPGTSMEISVQKKK